MTNPTEGLQAGGWRATVDKLPDDGETVWVMTAYGMVGQATYVREPFPHWRESTHFSHLIFYMYWRPLAYDRQASEPDGKR
jgi:hypothetical protein